VKTRFVLRLCGIDLRHVDQYDRLGPELGDINFEAVGDLTLATVLADGPDVVTAAVTAARLIEHSSPGVTVAGVYRERVGLSEIAERLGVGREAARLWAAGLRRSKRSFPAPHDVTAVGGRLSSQYSWGEVLDWARCEGLADDLSAEVREATVEQLAQFELRLREVRVAEPATAILHGDMAWSIRLETAHFIVRSATIAPDRDTYRSSLLRLHTVRP
jgi:hypothetical protein